jgi:hypothetical protein
MQEGIIKVTMQFLDGSPIEPKGVNSKWRNVLWCSCQGEM